MLTRVRNGRNINNDDNNNDKDKRDDGDDMCNFSKIVRQCKQVCSLACSNWQRP
jgi:hypothetical protein